MSRDILVVMAFDQALPSGLMGMADMLALASLSHQHSPDAACSSDMHEWQPQVVTASLKGREIVDGHGRSFKPDCAIEDIDQCQGVLIPGFIPCSNSLPPNPLTDKTSRNWLIRQSDRGALIGGSCSGGFVIGEAGLLNNRRCTTTWWLHYELKKRFPKANTAWCSNLVQDGHIITAGGPLSWVDICLRMIRLLAGNDAANRTADFAVVDHNAKSQDRYIPEGHLMSADPFLIAAENQVRQQLNRILRTVDLASSLSVSERTLNRRLKQLTGEAPKAFIDRVRMDMAKTLLHTTSKQINMIAFDLGYSDEAVFRRLFRKRVGMAPSEYRNWQGERGKGHVSTNT
jgi:transcriptional regulator GlxA family with amidase domain